MSVCLGATTEDGPQAFEFSSFKFLNGVVDTATHTTQKASTFTFRRSWLATSFKKTEQAMTLACGF